MIRIEIEGLDRLIEWVQHLVDPSSGIREQCLKVAAEALRNTVYDKIVNNPEIPRPVRESTAIVVDPARDEILMGPVFKAAVLKEYGRRTEWRLYRCPKLYYLQGKLARREEAGNYIERAWSENREEFIQQATEYLLDIIRGEVT